MKTLTKSRRLEVLENSLAKKTLDFDRKLQSHFDCVKSANGQPLNDKRNGQSTLDSWERQNNSLRALNQSIEKTKNAIEKEEGRIANVEGYEVPKCLREFLSDGVISQWRKHPRFFFVRGVERARIVVLDDGKIAHRYIKDIPSDEQYAIFRDVYNAARRIQESDSIPDQCKTVEAA